MLVKRAKVSRCTYATFRRWRSRDGRYTVIEIKSHLGLPTRYLAVENTATGERILSRHRVRSRAIDAIKTHTQGG